MKLSLFILLVTTSVIAHETPQDLVTGNDLRADFEQNLIEDNCSGKEEINRQLLQQNWFFNESKTDHGIIFGQTGFSDYSIAPYPSAAYCIDKRTLIVKYYNYEPNYFINGELISEQKFLKYRSIPSIKILVKMLTENKLVLFFPESKEELILHR